MKYIIFIIFTLNISQSVAQSVDDYNFRLSKSELQDDFKLLRAELEEKHPGLYLYTPKHQLDSLFASIHDSLIDDMRPIDFYRSINILNGYIKDAHTKIISPQSYRTALRSTLLRFPFHIYSVENKSYILENYSNDDSIKVGSEVIAINDIPIEQIRDSITSGMTRDGLNKSKMSDMLNNHFSILYGTIFGCSEVYTLKLRTLSDAITTKAVKALTYDQLLENGLEERLDRLAGLPALSSQLVDSVMIITLKSFVPEIIKGGSKMGYKNAFSELFDHLHNKEVKRLIIDIRGNPGGFPEVGNELLSYLIPYEFKVMKRDEAKVNQIKGEENYLPSENLKHFKKTKSEETVDGLYEMKGFQTNQKPKKNRFVGDLIVLIDGGCGSQSGMFSGLIEEHLDAVFIGEECGANSKIMCAGNIVTLQLKNSKLSVDIPLRLMEINSSSENTGHGVIPDVIVKPSVSQKLAGDDVALEKALNMKMAQ